MTHVFISYVNENKDDVNRVADLLRSSGAKVWIDRNDLEPGVFWKFAIKKAIRSGAFFLAFFSKQYLEKQKSYMNEEIAIAIEEIRLRPLNTKWFIPVVIDETTVPEYPINANSTLADIQAIFLTEEGANEKLLSTLNLDDHRLQRENLLLELLQSKFKNQRRHASDELSNGPAISDYTFSRLLKMAEESPEHRKNSILRLFSYSLRPDMEITLAEGLIDDLDVDLRIKGIETLTKYKKLSNFCYNELLLDKNTAIQVIAIKNVNMRDDGDLDILLNICNIIENGPKGLRMLAIRKVIQVVHLDIFRHLPEKIVDDIVEIIRKDKELWGYFSEFLKKQNSEMMIKSVVHNSIQLRNLVIQLHSERHLFEERFVLIVENVMSESLDLDVILSCAKISSSFRNKSLSATIQLHIERINRTGSQLIQNKFVKVPNRRGLHARASMKLVQTASLYKADIIISSDENAVKADSIMGLMMLAVAGGEYVHISTSGPESVDAMVAIFNLISDGFGQDISYY